MVMRKVIALWLVESLKDFSRISYSRGGLRVGLGGGGLFTINGYEGIFNMHTVDEEASLSHDYTHLGMLPHSSLGMVRWGGGSLVYKGE